MNSIHIAVISDSHGGSKVGLCNPDVTLHDEDKKGNQIPFVPNLNERQKDLWIQDVQTRELLIDTSGKRGAKGLIHLGEQMQGNKIPEDMMCNVLADQVRIACANLRPWLKIPGMKWVRLIQATGWHEFMDGSGSKLVADQLQAEFPNIDIKTYRHGVINADGILIEVMHHGPKDTKRKWLEGNNPRYYLRDRMLREITARRKVPALYLSGHVHTEVQEQLTIRAGDVWHNSAIVVMPPMCYMNDYAVKVSESSYEYITGEMIVRLTDGLPPALMPNYKVTDVRTEDVWT